MSANITYPLQVDGVTVKDPLEHLMAKFYRNPDGSVNREAFEVGVVYIHWFSSYTSQLSMFKNSRDESKQPIIIPMVSEQAIHDAHEGAAFRLMQYNAFYRHHGPSILPLIIQESVQLHSATKLDDHEDVVRLFAVRWGFLSAIAGLVSGSMSVQKEFDIELRKLLLKVNDEFLKKLPEMLRKTQANKP